MGHSGRFLATMSPRDSDAQLFTSDRWHPGQEMVSVQGGRSDPAVSLGSFPPNLFPIEAYCCDMKPARDALERALPSHSSQLERQFQTWRRPARSQCSRRER